MTTLSVDPLEVLQDDLKDESVQVQLEAIHSLQTIAKVLGPERNAKELYVALERYCFPVEVQASVSPEAYSNTNALAAKEEVLCAIGGVGKKTYLSYTFNNATHKYIKKKKNLKPNIHTEFFYVLFEAAAKNILPLLEKLAMVEETVIRQAAVASINKLIAKMKVEHVKTYAYPILNRLVEASWFTSRCSASALTAGLYKVLQLEEDRKNLLECHRRLCSDEMPMVKNDAYKNLVPLIEEMKSIQVIMPFARPLLESLQNELMETMRQCLVDVTKKIAEKSAEEKSQDAIPGFVKLAVEDDSWRVRKHIAENLADICSHLKGQKVTEDIAPLYVKLLSDNEPQVRKAAIGALETIIKYSDGQGFAQKIVTESLQPLLSDSVADVRETLAEQVACLGEYLTREGVKEKLLPIFKKLAADESPVTRLNLCMKLSTICKILGLELFESDILPLLKEVTVDQRWRVRNSIVVNIAQIGIQMGKDKFAKSRLKDILIQSLKDPAATVRETASRQVQSLNQSFGYEWMAEQVFTPMKNLYKDSGNYLHRMVPLKTVQLLCKDLTVQQLKGEFVDLLTTGLSDPISNVRFNACRVLVDVLPRLDSSTVSQFKTSLEKLAKQDDDPDVVFFATEALKGKWERDTFLFGVFQTSYAAAVIQFFLIFNFSQQ
ncbi:phosphoprotein phosphatase A [Reticulomyxa filosa]|uniref:Phosphoprotein phosphatase A n=1 Tax=Reticulomyxa filosa TaxID=46433 RepID=X6P6F9_RETFI|nr:phosphoprotein phosphatase A [Reticulomyxa filosa]|eukprot:ETO33766.1 phosphoprotein phosphatase A [Reticulomyxa filosa]